MIKEELSEICESSPAFCAEQEHRGSVLQSPGELEQVVLEQQTQIISNSTLYCTIKYDSSNGRLFKPGIRVRMTCTSPTAEKWERKEWRTADVRKDLKWRFKMHTAI